MTTSPQKHRIRETRQERREHVMEEQLEGLAELAQIQRAGRQQVDVTEATRLRQYATAGELS